MEDVEGVPSASTPDARVAQQPLMEGVPSASAPDTRGAQQPAMEVFQDVEFVRLRNLVHGKYVHADEDGSSVRLDACRASHNAVWAVRRHNSAGTLYVLLRGAYDRYLGAPDSFCCPLLCSFPCSRVAAAQRDFDEPETKAIMWRAVATSGEAVLLHDASERYLHASTRCLPCLTGVCVFTCGSPCTRSQWAVEIVHRSSAMPWLPIMNRNFFDVLGTLLALMCSPLERCTAPPKREVRWVLADDSGNVNEEHWVTFQYIGRGAYELETKLVALQPMTTSDRLTLCIRAGRHGQLSPLMIGHRACHGRDSSVCSVGHPRCGYRDGRGNT